MPSYHILQKDLKNMTGLSCIFGHFKLVLWVSQTCSMWFHWHIDTFACSCTGKNRFVLEFSQILKVEANLYVLYWGDEDLQLWYCSHFCSPWITVDGFILIKPVWSLYLYKEMWNVWKVIPLTNHSEIQIWGRLMSF